MNKKLVRIISIITAGNMVVSTLIVSVAMLFVH